MLNFAYVGSTSLLTTVVDLSRWVANFEHPVVGTPELLRQMQEPLRLASGQTVGYGFGLGVGLHRGLRVVQHKGVDAGFRSHVCWFPDEHLGVVLLANVSSIDAPSLALRAAELCLGLEEEPAPPDSPAPGGPDLLPLPVEQLQEYAGSYYSEELDTTYRVIPDGGGLRISHLRRGDRRCANVGPDTFMQAPAGPLKLRFIRSDGQVTGLRLDGGRVRNLWFARRTD